MSKTPDDRGMIHARIASETRRRASILAAAQEITLTQLIETALVRYIEKEWSKVITSE